MLIDTIYVEEEILQHPRSKKIIQTFPHARVILCQRYTEIFNRKNQSFRMQKEKPSLILAKKHKNFILPIKTNDSIGRKNNYYFSTSLNCPFDCQYCFLQGFYRSAHYVWFVNLEDFQKALETNYTDPSCFFTGYDTDSLALSSLFNFFEEFYPIFKKQKKHLFEIRSKSINISAILEKKPLENCIIAFSLNPSSIIEAFEKKTPSLQKRLQAIQSLQQKGWSCGLRFDPVIFHENYSVTYGHFFQEVFSHIDKEKIHSVTLGAARVPISYYRNMQKNHVFLPFLASLQKTSSYCMGFEKEQEIITFCKSELLRYFSENKIFLHTRD